MILRRVAVRRYQRVPVNPLSFWQSIHSRPRAGFFMGSGAATAADHIVYLSASEPASTSGRLPRLKQSRRFAGVPRFVGYLGFDAGRLFDPGLSRLPQQKDSLRTPPVFFGDYRAVIKLDMRKRRTTLFVSGLRAADLKRIDRKIKRWFDFERRSKEKNFRKGETALASFLLPSRAHFKRMVQKAKKAIARGDIYQANLSLLFNGVFAGNPVEFYRRLCRVNPSPYACLLKMPDHWIVSCSPELMVEVAGRRVVTRPIAGTRPRGKDAREDVRRRGQLLLSPKERAEHVMLVDLERNDLGRVCVPGSVTVQDRFSIERYSHVMHIVSQVSGFLAKGRTATDALAAVFPGGTITGCPKIKAVEVIESLEKEKRGPFYGSAGYFCWNGDAKLNILIRTALIQKNRIALRAGAGIVADSHPDREYREVLAKARVVLEAGKGTA